MRWFIYNWSGTYLGWSYDSRADVLKWVKKRWHGPFRLSRTAPVGIDNPRQWAV